MTNPNPQRPSCAEVFCAIMRERHPGTVWQLVPVEAPATRAVDVKPTQQEED